MWIVCATVTAREMPRIDFSHYTTRDGLAHNSGNCFAQDGHGFLWIGCNGGLERFDGYRFTIYKPEKGNPASLSGIIVWALHVDRFNTLWIGTIGGGLNKYVPEKDAFISYRHEPDNSQSLSNDNVARIFEDKQGRLWVATKGGGLNRFDRETGRFFRHGADPSDSNRLKSAVIHDCCLDANGEIWLGTENGISIFDPETGVIRGYHRNPGDLAVFDKMPVISLLACRDGAFWIGTFRRGLYRYEPGSGVYTSFIRDLKTPHALRGEDIYHIFEDRFGDVWIATENGVHRYFPDENGFLHYTADPNDPKSLSDNFVRTVFEDRTGVLWFGTNNGGLNKFDLHRKKFSHYTHKPMDPHSLSNSHVHTIHEDKSGLIWIGTRDGLNRFDKRTGRFTSYRNDPDDPHSLGHNTVLFVTSASPSEIWAGTDLGISRLDTRTGRFRHHRHDPADPKFLANNNVRCLHFDRSGALWIGTWGGGLNRFDLRTDTFTRHPVDDNITHNAVLSLLEDEAGLLWLGTFGKGLVKFDPASGDMTFYRADPDDPEKLRDNVINTVFRDREGLIWAGTAGGGLSCFNPEEETFVTFEVSDGLPSSEITGILEDARGDLWISTGKGLSRYSREKGTFTNYDEDDGLQGYVFYMNAFCQTQNGEMYFGGLNGFNTFFPEEIEANPFLPEIVITDLKIFNKSVRIGEKIHGREILKRPIHDAGEIILSHREDMFSLEFSALHFSAPKKNRFVYMLEGFDKGWILADASRRFVSYTTLKPGRYTFKVKASNNDGKWNPRAAEMGIVILPPFWQRWWFRAAAALMILCAVLTGHTCRIRSIERRRNELARLVDERTAELRQSNEEMKAFAYSISHDLRAPLRAMDGFSHVLLEEYAEKIDETGKDFLRRIRAGSQNMGHIIDELLKLSRLSHRELHVERVDLSGLVEWIAADLKQSDPDRRVEFKIEKNVIVSGDPTLIQVMMRNLIENAWKFTAKKPETLIEFGSFRENNQRIYFVKDNGIGFDMLYSDRLFQAFQRQNTEFEGTGIGLTTVHRIIGRHGGRIWAGGKIGEGATFYFTLELPEKSLEKGRHDEG